MKKIPILEYLTIGLVLAFCICIMWAFWHSPDSDEQLYLERLRVNSQEMMDENEKFLLNEIQKMKKEKI